MTKRKKKPQPPLAAPPSTNLKLTAPQEARLDGGIRESITPLWVAVTAARKKVARH